MKASHSTFFAITAFITRKSRLCCSLRAGCTKSLIISSTFLQPSQCCPDVLKSIASRFGNIWSRYRATITGFLTDDENGQKCCNPWVKTSVLDESGSLFWVFIVISSVFRWGQWRDRCSSPTSVGVVKLFVWGIWSDTILGQADAITTISSSEMDKDGKAQKTKAFDMR